MKTCTEEELRYLRHNREYHVNKRLRTNAMFYKETPKTDRRYERLKTFYLNVPLSPASPLFKTSTSTAHNTYPNDSFSTDLKFSKTAFNNISNYSKSTFNSSNYFNKTLSTSKFITSESNSNANSCPVPVFRSENDFTSSTDFYCLSLHERLWNVISADNENEKHALDDLSEMCDAAQMEFSTSLHPFFEVFYDRIDKSFDNSNLSYDMNHHRFNQFLEQSHNPMPDLKKINAFSFEEASNLNHSPCENILTDKSLKSLLQSSNLVKVEVAEKANSAYAFIKTSNNSGDMRNESTEKIVSGSEIPLKHSNQDISSLTSFEHTEVLSSWEAFTPSDDLFDQNHVHSTFGC